MGYVRGKYGVEYDPSRRYGPPRWAFWAVGATLVAVLVSVTWTMVSHIRLAARERAERKKIAESCIETTNKPIPAPRPLPAPPVERADISGRSKEVRNLLFRLNDAESRRDDEMAIQTIEQLRKLPGNPAADLDGKLTKRLGELNLRRMFEHKRGWGREIVVKRGDSASRIAFENGMTLAALRRLNGNVDTPTVGRKLYVLDHPQFTLNVYKVTKVAELSLKGKFFKRYYLEGEVSGQNGAYELPERVSSFFSDKGIRFSPADRRELEMLLVRGVPLVISAFK